MHRFSRARLGPSFAQSLTSATRDMFTVIRAIGETEKRLSMECHNLVEDATAPLKTTSGRYLSVQVPLSMPAVQITESSGISPSALASMGNQQPLPVYHAHPMSFHDLRPPRRTSTFLEAGVLLSDPKHRQY